MGLKERLSMALSGLIALTTAVLMSVLAATPAAASQTTVVSPSHMHGWVFIDDNTNGQGTGHMVVGPGNPPLRQGSAELAVTGVTDRQILVTAAYSGTRLADIEDLSYWTYQTDPTHALTIQFDVRYHPTDTGYQGRFVFEPGYYTNGIIATNTWQKWNPLSGRWWATRSPGSLVCGQASVGCSWSEILTLWPDASILNPGGLLFKAGGGWLPWKGNVDAFTIGISDRETTTYDFEPSTCREADGDGDFQGDRGHGNFHVDNDGCEESGQGGNGGDGDNVQSTDRGDGKDFQSTSIESSTFDPTTNALTVTGLGVSAGNPVAFTLVVVEPGLTMPGWVSLVFSDGYSNAGNLLSGSIVLN